MHLFFLWAMCTEQFETQKMKEGGNVLLAREQIGVRQQTITSANLEFVRTSQSMVYVHVYT